jgi:hypothetical protein
VTRRRSHQTAPALRVADQGAEDKPAEQVPAPAPAEGPPFVDGMSLLRALGAAIAWLSGSLAAITAIFYAFGYLATLANLDMLGLDLLAFHYDSSFYIARGADALLLSGTVIGGFWLALFVVLGLFAAAGDMPNRIGGWLSAKPLLRLLIHFRMPAKPWLYVLLLAIILWLVAGSWQMLPFPSDLGVSGVLYSDTADGAARSVRQWIVAGDTLRLNELYGAFVVREGVLATFIIVAWALTRGWRRRAAAMPPFAVVGATALVWRRSNTAKLRCSRNSPRYRSG